MASEPKQSKLTSIDTDTRIVRKSNDEIAYKVRSGHLSLLSRKIFNVLIWHAQEQRNKEEGGRWDVSVSQLIKDAKFNSKDYDLLRKALDELQDVRVVRQARGGGVTSEVLIPSYTLDNVVHEGNEELARGQKRRGGELRLWFMLPPELKAQLLDPAQYTRLPITIMASLKTVPGLALYEICRRYVTNAGGLTNKDSWQNWWRVLTGATPDQDPPEFKYANRDVFKRGVDEVNKLTDIQVEVLEVKDGKFVRELQFSARMKPQGSLDMGPPPIDAGVLARVTSLGLTISDAERISVKYSEADLVATLSLVEERIAHPRLAAIESPAAYFRKALRDQYATAKVLADQSKLKKRNERDQKRKAIESAVEDVTPSATTTNALKRFDALPESDKLNVLSDFSKDNPSLAAKVRADPMAPLVRKTLGPWLVKRGGEGG
jgi:hypothetical protein